MANIKSETTGQKHISTIATDIKQLISDISTGKPANMTEENLNVFLNNIKEAILAWNTSQVKAEKSSLMNVAWHYSNFTFIRSYYSWTIWSYQSAFRIL